MRSLASSRADHGAPDALAIGKRLLPPSEEQATDPGPPLATGLTLEAWIDHAEPGGEATEHQIVIRNIHGTHAADGCPEPFALRARCETTGSTRLFLVERISGLRARRAGPSMTRAEDIAMWLRVESGLLHQRDIERLTGLRRRAQEEAESLDQPGRDRRWVEPTAIRIETTRDDAPMARRIEEMLLLSWDPGPDGAPAVIYVAKDAEARRGRAVRIAPGGDAPNRLLMLQAPAGTAIPVAEVPHWVAGLPQRRTVMAAAQ
ncbi:hypothetical protein [Falsiroseomonas sp. HW251]|uniref:hypothetical protein n=1 Tax=Falsiroseomonas sp. HW251 TaxID=3390998 RepID=UPI003D314417